MPKDEWIVEALEDRDDARKFVSKLSDEQFVHLDITKEIESLELSIKLKTDSLKELKTVLKKFKGKKLPIVPENLKYVLREVLLQGQYRFRGRRDVQHKLYGAE